MAKRQIDESEGYQIPSRLIDHIFRSTADGVYAVDEQGRIIAINDAALRMLGVTRESALGKPCHEVLKLNICREYCALREARASGRPIGNLAVDILRGRNMRTPAILSSAVLFDEQQCEIGGVETIRDLSAVRQSLRVLERQQPLATMLSGDPQMQHLFEILPTIAASASCILITGETGTGKNLVARAVHNLSSRREGPFVTVNCAALPESLLESELFGYRAGAFTGAHRDRIGRVAAAEGGTLFLDEIGDIPLAMQVKLLRFLQDKTYERLGDVKPQIADLRLVAATNQDLNQLVEQGRFRRDLYYRINVLNVHLPPLRERQGDIPLLVQRFLERFSTQRGKQVTSVTRPVLDLLKQFRYPGNIRELENIIEHAYVLCDGAVIGPEHVPRRLQTTLRLEGDTTPTSLAENEARFLADILERHQWNRQATADALGIHRTTLQRRIRQLDLKLPRRDGRSRHRR